MWEVADDPTNPLVTWTKLITPLFVIGPILVVPKPTLTIPIYSSSTLRISFGDIVDIPLKENIVDPALIWPPFPDSVCDILLNIKGYCVKLSIVISPFSFFLNISSWCALPRPYEVNVTPIPNCA